MAHNKTQPLYMYLAFQSVHRPLQAPAMYTRLYDGQGLTGPEKVRFIRKFLKIPPVEPIVVLGQRYTRRKIWQENSFVTSTRQQMPWS